MYMNDTYLRKVEVYENSLWDLWGLTHDPPKIDIYSKMLNVMFLNN